MASPVPSSACGTPGCFPGSAGCAHLLASSPHAAAPLLGWAQGLASPVSQGLQRYISNLTAAAAGGPWNLDSVDFGGAGDCLFLSIAGILARMVLQGGEPARHVLRKIPSSIFARGKYAVMQALRDEAATVFHQWSEEDVLNFMFTACMEMDRGAHLDRWDPFHLLAECSLQSMATRGSVPETIRAWQDEPDGSAVAQLAYAEARRGGVAPRDHIVRLPDGTESLRQLRYKLAHWMSRPGNVHWGTQTDVCSLSERLELGILLFRDRLPTGSQSCVYNIGSQRDRYPHWIALWWIEPTHFRGAQLQCQSSWTDEELPQALRDQYAACNGNARARRSSPWTPPSSLRRRPPPCELRALAPTDAF